MNAPRTLIVGIGSPHGDDQVGWQVAGRLASRCDARRVAVRKAASPTDLLDWLDRVDRLVLCDACRGMGRVGAARRWDWPADELLSATWSGTHNVALPDALQLAARLSRLPREVVIWTIEGAGGEPLAPPSLEVAAAVPPVVAAIEEELNGRIACTNVRS